VKFLILIATALFSFSANAAEIKDARFNTENLTLEIDVAYGGGLTEHSFDLEFGRCLHSYPAQCFATLLHTSSEPES